MKASVFLHSSHPSDNDRHAMQIYLWQNGERTGPYTEQKLREMVRYGGLDETTPECREGTSAPQSLNTIISFDSQHDAIAKGRREDSSNTKPKPFPTQIYLYDDGKSVGPWTVQDLREMIKSGGITKTSLARMDGEWEWKPLKKIIFPASCWKKKALAIGAIALLCSILVYSVLNEKHGDSKFPDDLKKKTEEAKIEKAAEALEKSIKALPFVVGLYVFAIYVSRQIVSRLFIVGKAGSLIKNSLRPILYLRSFKDDKRVWQNSGFWTFFNYKSTAEESLARIFKRIGPFIAIGNPRDLLPTLGAAKMYVGHADWKSVVKELISRSRLIVVRVGETEALSWEFEQIIRQAAARNVVLYHPADGGAVVYNKFRQRADQLLWHPLPPQLGNCELVMFSANWESSARCVVFTGWELVRNKLMFWSDLPAIRALFRPVFRQLHIPLPSEFQLFLSGVGVFVLRYIVIPVALLLIAIVIFSRL